MHFGLVNGSLKGQDGSYGLVSDLPRCGLYGTPKDVERDQQLA